MDILALVTSNAAGLGAVGAAIAFIWSVFQFLATRRKDQRAREFETYHRLIKELVAPDPETKFTWIDRQMAVLFELRHFPRYFEVTLRILAGLREKWSTDAEMKWPRLIQELDLTVAYICRKKPNLSLNPDASPAALARRPLGAG